MPDCLFSWFVNDVPFCALVNEVQHLLRVDYTVSMANSPLIVLEVGLPLAFADDSHVWFGDQQVWSRIEPKESENVLGLFVEFDSGEEGGVVLCVDGSLERV